MNYSIIQAAREELGKYEKDYKDIRKRVNLSLFSLARTNLNSAEKKKFWMGLSESVKNISEKAEKIVSKLNGIHFAEEEGVLNEERDLIKKEYNKLLHELQGEKETIVRQIEKDIIPITPLQQKLPKEGYCYFCEIKISSGVPYRLTKEEQEVLEIEIVEGAGFCSQDCLLNHCREYKNRDKIRQEEEKENEEKIRSGKKLITQIQLVVSELIDKINKLEKKEEELELNIDTLSSEEKTGFFRRVMQGLGLVKKNDPHTRLAEIKSKRIRLEKKLEKKSEELQKTLVILSVDEQVQRERQSSKKRLFEGKRSIRTKANNVSEE